MSDPSKTGKEPIDGTSVSSKGIDKEKGPETRPGQAEVTLREDKAFLNTLLDAIPIPVFYKDRDGRYRGFNRSFETFFGTTREQLIGKTVFEVGPPEFAASYDAKDTELFENGGVQQYESQVKDHRGLTRDVIFDKAIFTDSEGTVSGLIGTILDITERKQAEEALKDREKALQALFDAVHESMVLIDPEGTVILSNEVGAQRLGTTVSELLGACLYDHFPPGTSEYRKERYEKVVATGEPVYFQDSRLGRFFEHYCYPVFDGKKVVSGVTIFAHEITEQKKAEIDLRHNATRMKHLLEMTRLRGRSLREITTYALEACVTLTESESGFFHFYNEDSGEITLNTWSRNVESGCSVNQDQHYPLDKAGIWADCVRLRKPTIYNDYPNTPERKGYPSGHFPVRSFLSVPVMEQDKVVMICGVGNKATPYTQADIDEITLFMSGAWTTIKEMRSEEARRESEERYRNFFMTSRDAVFVTSPSGEWIDFNDASLELFGYESRGELSHMPVSRLFERKEDRLQVLRLISEKGYVHECPVRLKTKDGAVMDALITAVPLRRDDGSIKTFVGTIRDITARKKMEESLKSSEAELKLTIDATTDGIWTWNPKTHQLWFTPKSYTMLGYAPGEFAATFGSLVKMMHPDDIKDASEVVKTFLKTKPDVYENEFRLRAKNGDYRWILAKGHVVERNEQGEATRIIGSHTDITERRQAEESLRESEAKYRSIFENSLEGIYRTTRSGTILMANAAFCHQLGYSSLEELAAMVTDVATQLYVNPDDRDRLLGMLDAQTAVKGFETRFSKKDGTMIWVHINIMAVRDESGDVLYYEGINEDVTDHKEAQEKAEKSAAQLQKAMMETIHAIVSMSEFRDPYTAGHQNRVADIAAAIATELGLSQEQVNGIGIAGLIHDVGKICVPAEILSKPGILSRLEKSLIESHVMAGYQIIKDIEFPWPIRKAVLQHHERLDGSGYPSGISGEDIVVEARIIAVADVVEAMSSHRPYRPSRGIDLALEEIEKNKGILYDERAVDACVKLFREQGFVFEGNEPRHT